MKAIVFSLLMSLISCASFAQITGNSSICLPGNTQLSDTVSGGTWASSAPAKATVSASGLVTGLSPGSVTITYAVNGTNTTKSVTVNALPAAIAGPAIICVGNYVTLSDATVGGLWSSQYTSTALVGSANGVVTGISSGTSTITYSTGPGCNATTVVSVNTAPSGIFGQLNICASTQTVLSDSIAGGAWSSSNAAIATVGTTFGVFLSTATQGSSTITYTLPTGCAKTATLNVYSTPPAISGSTNVRVNGNIHLTNLIAGGTWTCGNSAVATIAPIASSPVSEAVVFGVSNGTAVITYTACGTSTATTTITVNNAIPKIAADSFVFLGALFSNFTGVQDDNPSGFTETYLRLSHSLFQPEGIDYNSNMCRRWILMRNFMFEVSFNNNNSNFKMYSVDTFGNKYVNRLDLLAHSYFNGSIYVNLLTFILPQLPHTGVLHKKNATDSERHNGDGAHIFLDFFTNLSLTNVNDSIIFNGAYVQKTYNIKTNLYGFNLKYATTSGIRNTPFNIELGTQLFWLFPSTNTVNPNLNPQYNNIDDLRNLQNSSIGILAKSKNVYPYLSLLALVQYNTNPGKSSSNVFFRYRYIDNYVYDVSNTHYHNSYFEFQFGYALDLSKLIPTATN